MRYLFRAELPHQILFFSYSYDWRQKASAEAFARDFIKAEFAIEREKIPDAMLHTVMTAARHVIPEEIFMIQE